MLKKNKLITFLLTVFTVTSSLAASNECQQRNIRFLNNKKMVMKRESVCLLKEDSGSSKNCMLPNIPACPFSKIKKDLSYDSFLSEISTPGINLCTHLGGRAEAYEMAVRGKWLPYERCIYKNTQEFVELNELIRYYKTL